MSIIDIIIKKEKKTFKKETLKRLIKNMLFLRVKTSH